MVKVKAFILLILLSISSLGNEKNWKVLKRYQNKIPDEIQLEIKYEGSLPHFFSYVFPKKNKVNLREGPSSKSILKGIADYLEKLAVLEVVENSQGEKWYKVLNPGGGEAFIHYDTVKFMEFRFIHMREEIYQLEEFIEKELSRGRILSAVDAYRPNPSNKNAKKRKDKYGNVEEQSAAAYYKGEMIFIPDGRLLSLLKNNGKSSQVKSLGVDEFPLEINNKLLNKNLRIGEVPKKIIVVYLRNQNFGVFEWIADEWTLISYSYSKTGKENHIGYETPKGVFVVSEVKKIMTYTNARGEIVGYANNALRFSGGGYIHGTPINYKDKFLPPYLKDMKEAKMGTYPETRKCVRNTVKHSEFLFDWILNGKSKRGNSQIPEDPALVIVM